MKTYTKIPIREKWLFSEEARKSFKEEALASWKTYQETGHHLTGEEVRDWLNTWGTDKETPIPKCHK